MKVWQNKKGVEKRKTGMESRAEFWTEAAQDYMASSSLPYVPHAKFSWNKPNNTAANWLAEKVTVCGKCSMVQQSFQGR